MQRLKCAWSVIFRPRPLLTLSAQITAMHKSAHASSEDVAPRAITIANPDKHPAPRFGRSSTIALPARSPSEHADALHSASPAYRTPQAGCKSRESLAWWIETRVSANQSIHPDQHDAQTGLPTATATEAPTKQRQSSSGRRMSCQR